MAIHPQPQEEGSSIQPGRYSERRVPQFVGGATDPSTGNVIPGSRSDAASGRTAALLNEETPTPQTPTTRLGEMEADEPKPPGLVGALAGTAAPFVGSSVGSSVGGLVGGGLPLGEAVKETASNIGGVLSSGGGGSGAVPIGTTVGASPLGSSVGGAAGAGIGTALVGAATGAKPKEYLPAAAGAAIGSYVGGLVLTPILGPFAPAVGSFLGSHFCHAAGTPIVMEDGSHKAVEDIKIGDRALLGGVVLGRGEVMTNDLYRYKGTAVNGRHAVFEDGRWLRVQDSERAERIETWTIPVYPLVTEHHVLVCEEYICADFAETDDADMSASERLAKLNADAKRNAELKHAEHVLGLIPHDAAA